MKSRLPLIACLISVSAWGQQDFKSYRQTYFESNFGIALLSQESFVGAFPGYSFLRGRRKFYSRDKFTDAQIGFALPTAVTAKIGVGKLNFNKETSNSFGLRIFPAHIYIQHNRPTHKLKEKRINKINERSILLSQNTQIPNIQKSKNAICGELNFSIEVGAGDLRALEGVSFFSIAMVTIGYRIYFDFVDAQ